jgi:NADH-quinone oxidoreductase subunit J
LRLTAVIFYVLAAFSVVSAFMVVMARSPMRCALGLMFTFLGLAGIYVLLHAHLIAVLQILIYAGGVTVLFAFVIMMMRQGQQISYPGPFMPVRVLSVITVFYLVYVVGPVLVEVERARSALPAGYGTVRLVGEVLFSKHVVPFEATGVLLLVTMIAAISIIGRSRPRYAGPDAPDASPGAPGGPGGPAGPVGHVGPGVPGGGPGGLAGPKGSP